MIIWSEEAKYSYENIIDDILAKWNVKTALNFEQKVNNLLEKLQINNHLYPATNYKDLRKCVVHKNSSLIYKINQENIEVVTLIFNKDNHKYY
ncbi:type II toxin-antitoxin system RelE/ParE family toxin [Brumimicrobium aurantiacum]|uniref:Type II toxin-antitoxin system RelE/ParE family toxin n=1 Tax=Brumimicrobium aurantiacum TaxID=1737063 RepID=A0A3E1EZJ8_9FLAO|nr:type II toxin-antitoxin system RelE/ParE family toxin [Brumimicrobium aurantiacum]RFC54976.1 type II toxin-antitoxin system RelE/ParE family toxin [Brumimicrobium aurantiacum]